MHKKLNVKLPNFLCELFYKFLFFILNTLQNLSKTYFSSKDVEKEKYKNMIRAYYEDNLIQGERSKEWVQWRYSSNSLINYFLEYIFFGDELIGYFAYRKKEKYGFQILVLMEIVIIKKNILIEITILLKLISIAIKQKCDLIFI